MTNPENRNLCSPVHARWGEKTVLGHKIPAGGGESDGLRVVDILFTKSTARFISRNWLNASCRRTAAVAGGSHGANIHETDGDLRAVLRPYSSPEFFSEGASRSGSNRLLRWW